MVLRVGPWLRSGRVLTGNERGLLSLLPRVLVRNTRPWAAAAVAAAAAPCKEKEQSTLSPGASQPSTRPLHHRRRLETRTLVAALRFNAASTPHARNAHTRLRSVETTSTTSERTSQDQVAQHHQLPGSRR